ncbi:MAG: hypothetical protein ILO36_02995, partial [Abditibacteriota bacterium]|nr:hypothetical protein [Abditibacteriota bacterium]
MRFIIAAVLILSALPVLGLPRAALVKDPAMTPDGLRAAEALGEAFSPFYEIKEIDFDALVSLDRKDADAVLIAEGGRLPLESAASVERFAKAGGDIAALRAPLWKNPCVKGPEGYEPLEEYRKKALDTKPDTVFFDGSSAEGWKRSFSEKEKNAAVSVSEYRGRKCLDVALENLSNYDTLSLRADRPFSRGENVLEIVASGTEETNQLVVEIGERDGSRWMAVVPLSEEWQRHYVHLRQFGRWSGGENRGFPGDMPRLSEAAYISVGLALTHVPAVGEGPRHYRIAGIGASVAGERHTPLLGASALPDLDALSPSWKAFVCRGVKTVRTDPAQRIAPQADLPLPSSVWALNPRQQGGGYNKGRDWRYINLLEARGPKGEFRGTPAALKAHFSGDFAGSVFLSFAPADMKWYCRREVKQVIGRAAEAMARGVFLLDGGSDYYTCFPDMQPLGGARIVNVSDTPRDVECSIAADGRTVFYRRLRAEPGRLYDFSLPLEADKSRETLVSASLSAEGKEIDRAENALAFRNKTEKRFVTMENGHFMLDGRVWKPWGVNYMPSSGAGNDKEYFNNYLADYSYDPVVVERDFQKLKEIGFNSINIFVFTGYAADMNLLDMLRLADNYGGKAVLSLRPGSPFDTVSESAEELIPLLRLAEDATVYSYDVAWEPSWGDVGNK